MGIDIKLIFIDKLNKLFYSHHMNSIIVRLLDGTFQRIVRKNTTEKQFDLIIKNASVFGVNELYSDKQEHFNGMFPRVNFNGIETVEL